MSLINPYLVLGIPDESHIPIEDRRYTGPYVPSAHAHNQIAGTFEEQLARAKEGRFTDRRQTEKRRFNDVDLLKDLMITMECNPGLVRRLAYLIQWAEAQREAGQPPVESEGKHTPKRGKRTPDITEVL